MELSKKQLGLIALVIVLVIGNIAFAYLYVTRNVDFTGGVSTVGDIIVFKDDVTTELTSFDFINFTGGVPQGHLLGFFINNTGNQPVYVYWNITTSSIAWFKGGTGYQYNEEATAKYTFGIYNATGWWTPDTGARRIGVGERIQETYSLSYTGSPVTAEAFSFTVTFYARDA
ncbi:MAG: hypothetical protein JSW29_05090 [Candidatus Bathyarchaeota archaeon]|nr:MAG: hypothetical protein JSW29_05090 [Candidatus Bathyarchaeota archaeon]